MTDEVLFQNSSWVSAVALIAIALWVLFVWKEWRKPATNHFYLNILIAFVTISSVAMLALKPLVKGTNQSRVGVLLTERFNQERLDSLKRLYPELKEVSYQENLQISTVLDSLSRIYILGEGIAPFDFWQFKNRSVIYLGADLPSGIVNLKYSKENIVGEELILKGEYHNAAAKTSLVLEDGNGLVIDSLMLNESKVQNFELKLPLKAVGKFVFKLVEKDSLGKSFLSEPVPFIVLKSKSLKVLIVNGFPTFETKYLKNYMAEMGHEVVVRSQLTKGRYKFEYFNTRKTPVYSLNEKELADFDLLIIDANSFRNLSRRTESSVENVIKNGGMGLFIQPTFSLFQLPKERTGLQFQRDGVSKVKLNEFPTLTMEKLPFKFKNDYGLEEIHNSKENLLTAYKHMQKGRVGATVLQNTYQLQLNGKTEIYGQFWATIINKMARKEKLNTEWDFTTSFPLENHPFQFVLRTTIKKPQVRTEENDIIALQQHTDISSHWKGVVYPKKKGWNTLYLNSEIPEATNHYVFDSLSWRSLQGSNRLKENKRHFTSTAETSEQTTSTKPVTPLWFFLIGLLGMGYLWLQPKLFQN